MSRIALNYELRDRSQFWSRFWNYPSSVYVVFLRYEIETQWRGGSSFSYNLHRGSFSYRSFLQDFAYDEHLKKCRFFRIATPRPAVDFNPSHNTLCGTYTVYLPSFDMLKKSIFESALTFRSLEAWSEMVKGFEGGKKSTLVLLVASTQNYKKDVVTIPN